MKSEHEKKAQMTKRETDRRRERGRCETASNRDEKQRRVRGGEEI